MMRGDDFFRQVAGAPPFTRLPPAVGSFFLEYLSREKVIPFGGGHVVNTNFPPYPGAAFDNLVEHFVQLGTPGTPHLYSVTLAVTNRCTFRCWHCYNAGRSQEDLPLAQLERLAGELQERSAVMVTLTGGEPLLRADLERIAGCFGERTFLKLGTTGDGLTLDRARALRNAGVFAVGLSLDSADPEEHDRLRGRAGAFQTAVEGLRAAREAGLYPYVVAVATRELLPEERFFPFLELAQQLGALEVHLLQPSATGRLAGRTEVLLDREEEDRILDYQARVAADPDLPILSTFAYLESPTAFGCGAGLTHLYIDGSGEVSPCNLVPLSFGNVTEHPLEVILARMGEHLRRPRRGCVGCQLAPHLPAGPLPVPFEESRKLCLAHLPADHEVPAFFNIREAALPGVGPAELQEAYDRVGEDYDDAWLTEAAMPIDALLTRLPLHGTETVFEAGCGTGYATALTAPHVLRLHAVDLSDGMLRRARERLAALDRSRVELQQGDALAALRQHEAPLDVILTTWVLGYVPVAPFLDAARDALAPGGRLAFLVHCKGSPREPLEIFSGLVGRDPSVLTRQVAFDFPRDAGHLETLVREAGLELLHLEEGAISFPCPGPSGVLEHLLRSGAGTAFHDAIDVDRREALLEAFLQELEARHPGEQIIQVQHDYLSCIARRACP